jgi:hypothetical protein
MMQTCKTNKLIRHCDQEINRKVMLYSNFGSKASQQKVCIFIDRIEKLASVTLSNVFEMFNRIPVMAPILALIFGVHFFRGHISLKNGTFCPFFSHDSSSFKGTCFLTRLIVLLDALYGPHLHCCSHRPTL